MNKMWATVRIFFACRPRGLVSSLLEPRLSARTIMVRVSLLVVTLVSLLAPVMEVRAQGYGTSTSGLISTAESRRYGLVRPWFTQVRVDRGRGRLVQVYHHINSKRAETFYDVHHERGVQSLFSQQSGDLDHTDVG